MIRAYFPNCRQAASIAVVVLAAMFIIPCSFQCFASAQESEEPKIVQFFSIGKTVNNPADQTASKQQATEDLLEQAVAQASSRFMGPSQTGVQYGDLQKKVLSNAKKYVDSYQVFSEKQAGGLHRVLGQVAVSMDLLQKDLVEFGFPLAGATAGNEKSMAEAEQSESSSAKTAAEEENQPEQAQAAANNESAKTAERTAQAQPSEQKQVIEINPEKSKSASSRGLKVTKKEVVWAVTEKWDEEWVLPGGKPDDKTLFAQAIVRELDDYDYTLHFAEQGLVKADNTGSIPDTQVIRLAQGLGIQEAVVGSVTLRQEHGKPARLDVFLRVLSVGGGTVRGEVKRTIGLEEISNHDAAMDLATRVAPQLNALLGGAERSGATAGSGTSTVVESKKAEDGSASEQSSAQTKEAAGRLTVIIPSAQFQFWRELEKVLRDNFKGMKVTGIQVGPAEGTVTLEGIDGNSILRMSGTALPGGAKIGVESASAGTIKLSFTPPAAKAEPKQ